MRARSRWLMMGCTMLAHCDPNIADYCAPGTPECTAPDGSTDASSDGSGVTPDGMDGGDTGLGPTADASDALACDPTAAPRDEPCVIDDALGVFVSASGSDANPGTRAAPLQTIGHGMDSARSTGKHNVFVCAGSFAETLVVGASRDGLSVYGGLDCARWSYAATNGVTVAPTQRGYALDIEGLASGVTFEDVVFGAQNANVANPGESSIAVFVSSSQNVVLYRVTMVAGTATDGAPGPSSGHNPDGGTNGVSNWFGTPPGYAQLNGTNATSAAGGTQRVCTCPDATMSVGGRGGGGVDAGVQVPGPGLPSYGIDGGGSPGTNGTSCGSGTTTGDGVDAPKGSTDALSASWGTLNPVGWAPAVGTIGSNGRPGQGGGGGGNGPAGVGGGGSGACGGCGGAGGRPGTGGGASIALLSYQSEVALVGCTLVAHNAGNGGPAGSGESGQAGSLVGGNQNGSGCPGGAGGSSAGGNGAQGGPGGLSLGIGFTGTPPMFNGSSVASGQSLGGVVVGAAGAGGRNGVAGPAAMTSVGLPQSGADGPPSAAGTAQAVLGF